MRRKLTQRGKDRRLQLMEHASKLFAARGYHPTSVADIVESLGVGKGVFYWYFSSKEELLAEILRESHQALRRRQQQAIGDEPNPVVRIELGIRASIGWFLDHRRSFTLFQFAASDERFAPVLRRNHDVAIADTVRHIKEAIVDGLIADQNPEVLAEAMVGAINQLTQTYVFERSEPVDRTAEAAVSFCLHGLVGK
ncbi:MAG: TetR/AcrR family transcriptional regulator [Actinomycetota bacterium]|jgi:AcrR family transcriptional regulator|nr:TetR/AcrR family transcriptional regulator [Actinomycetota bacterium]